MNNKDITLAAIDLKKNDDEIYKACLASGHIILRPQIRSLSYYINIITENLKELELSYE